MIKDQMESFIKDALQKAHLPYADIVISAPSNESFGDYTTTVALHLAKQEKKNPLEVARIIVDNFPPSDDIEKVEVIKPGFINFWLSQNTLLHETKNITDQTGYYGRSETNKNKKVIVEYSSPNIAKPFTVGHLRSTIIGDAIAHLLEATGYTVFRDNHVGDWGTQFGKQIYAIKTWGHIEEIEKADRPVKKLVELYVQFHEEAEKDPALEEEGRKWFKKLEEGDTEARELWQKCIDWSWKEFKKIYNKLNVSFSENNGRGYGESFFEDKMGEVLKELETHDWYKDSQGAKLVFFPEDIYPPLMIIKQDGATLYSTRDLATDKFRLTNPRYSSDIKIINEVGAEQSLYFQQLFETEKMLGWIKDGQRVHVKHGLYRFKDTKMSTRKGNTIWLEDVLEEAIKRAAELAKDNKAQTNDIPESVGIGALKWNDLKRSSHLDVVFDWDEILNMQGNSGPYMQYTYVRCKSVLENAGNFSFNNLVQPEMNKEERELLSTIIKYPEVVLSAAENYSPHIVTNYLFNLAQKFNLFYQNNPILKSEEPTKSLRLLITKVSAQVIQNGLNLLGIQTVEKM